MDAEAAAENAGGSCGRRMEAEAAFEKWMRKLYSEIGMDGRPKIGMDGVHELIWTAHTNF